MKAFVDTHIFIDFYFDRSDRIKPLGEFAFQFFKRAVECEYFVLICQQVIDEISSVLSIDEKDFRDILLGNLKKANKVELVSVSKSQLREARDIATAKNLSLFDCLFAILARDNKAMLVSRDKHHHETLANTVRVFTPEELL